MSEKRIWAARAGLASGFVLLCLFMRGIAAQHNLVVATGAPVLWYNLASILFVVLSGASFYSWGAALVPARGMRSALDVFLVRSLAGFSLLSLLGYGLGMAKLLLPGVAMAVLALPLLWFPAQALPPYALRGKVWCRLSFFAAVALYLLCCSGVLFYYLENDFSHYYYFYDTALSRGDLLPNISYFAYFYMKGAGAPFLLMAASTKFSVQLATLYALLFMGLLSFRLCSMLTRNPAAAVAAALFPLASKAMKIESFKGHTLTSMFLLAVPYLMSRLLLGPEPTRPQVRLALALTLCATILLTPPAAVFLVLPLLFLLGSSWSNGRCAKFSTAFAVACVPAFTFILMLASNHLLTGIAEITPITFFKQFYDYDLTSRWISNATLGISLIENTGLDGFVFPAGRIVALIGSGFVLLTVIVLVRKRLKAVNPVLLKRAEVVLGPLLALGLTCPTVAAVNVQSSFTRLIVFYSYVQGIYVVAGIVLGAAVLWPLLRKRFPGLWPLRKFVLALSGVMIAYALVFNWTPKLTHQATHTRYFFGAAPMAPLVGHWFRPEVAEAERFVPDGVSVLPLYFSPYATFFKPQKYLRQMLNPHNKDLATMLGPDAQKARAVYLRENLRHFLVNLSPEPDVMLSMVAEAYGEMFSPAEVAGHFRVRPLGGHVWLMVLEGTDADGQRPDAAFLAAYEQRRSADMANPRNIFYPHLQRARKEIPSLRLPEGAPAGIQ